MSKNIIIQNDGVESVYTNVKKLKTRKADGGLIYWLPEDDVQKGTITIRKNGTYTARTNGLYAYGEAIVNVPPTPVSIKGKGQDEKYYEITIDDSGYIEEQETTPYQYATSDLFPDVHFPLLQKYVAIEHSYTYGQDGRAGYEIYELGCKMTAFVMWSGGVRFIIAYPAESGSTGIMAKYYTYIINPENKLIRQNGMQPITQSFEHNNQIVFGGYFDVNNERCIYDTSILPVEPRDGRFSIEDEKIAWTLIYGSIN